MCNTNTKKVSPFLIAQYFSSLYYSNGGQIFKNIIRGQVQQLIKINRLVNQLRVEVIGLLSPRKLGTYIVAIYWKPQ